MDRVFWARRGERITAPRSRSVRVLRGRGGWDGRSVLCVGARACGAARVSQNKSFCFMYTEKNKNRLADLYLARIAYSTSTPSLKRIATGQCSGTRESRVHLINVLATCVCGMLLNDNVLVLAFSCAMAVWTWDALMLWEGESLPRNTPLIAIAGATL